MTKASSGAAPLGLVLAGGLARRMGGGDKARIRVAGKTILERVLACLKPQCAAVILNANGDPARFADTGLPVVADSVPGFAGPLAGILAGLDWAAEHRPDCPMLVSVPTDAPFLPDDLVARMLRGMEADGAVAVTTGIRPGRDQSSIGFFRRDETALVWDLASGTIWHTLTGHVGGAVDPRVRMRNAAAWTARHGVAIADWPATPVDPFINVNTPADVAEAERIAAQQCDV